MPRNQVPRLPARQHPGHQPSRVAQHHHQHRQQASHAGPERDPLGREPQVALRQLPWDVTRPRRWILWPVLRAQLPHPPLEHRQPPHPADPLRDYCRRHVRRLLEQGTDLRFHLVHDRARRLAHVPRRIDCPQRRADRVPRHPHLPGDRLDRHPLRPMQATDFRPVFHVQHLRNVLGGGHF